MRWTRTHRQHGASWQAIAGELRIPAESFRRWMMAEVQQEPVLVPIEVVADQDDGVVSSLEESERLAV